MSKRMTKHTLNERIEAVLGVIEHKMSVNAIAKEYDVDETTIRSWVHMYKADGVDGLKAPKKWNRYSIFKKQGYRVVVEKHLVFYTLNKGEKSVIIYAIVDGRQEYRNLI